MNRVREASTMSVPTMRQMLGLKKTASYWLIKKQWFDVLIIHGEMRVVISSFETWYANQTHYAAGRRAAKEVVFREGYF